MKLPNSDAGKLEKNIEMRAENETQQSQINSLMNSEG